MLWHAPCAASQSRHLSTKTYVDAFRLCDCKPLQKFQSRYVGLKRLDFEVERGFDSGRLMSDTQGQIEMRSRVESRFDAEEMPLLSGNDSSVVSFHLNDDVYRVLTACRRG